MTVRIVGVHGVGNHRPESAPAQAATELARTWHGQLRPGLVDCPPVDLTVVYYAPYLNRIVAQAGADSVDHLTAGQHAALVAWADQLGVLPGDVAQAAWSVPARMIVDRIAERRRLNAVLLRPFVATFLREVDGYLRTPDSAARRGARDAVARVIRERRPAVVIAHSLGSVVAYEALRAYPDLSVDLLITIGSPLGMAGVVFERLAGCPDSPLGNRPPTVRRWVNVADPGDIVAVPRPFTRRFRPDENHEREHIHPVDFHTAARYLSAGPTIRALTGLLGRSGAARPAVGPDDVERV
jgi:hypothetical protein